MRFPNTELALREVIAAGTSARTVSHLPEDMYADLPIVQVIGLPTPAGVEPFLRTDMVQIDVYAEGKTAAKALSDEIHYLMQGYMKTSHGFLDDVYPSILPNEVPIEHDRANLYSATYSVDTRPLKN